MREIKFRQAIYVKNKFNHWHYWGFMPNLSFVGPDMVNGIAHALENSGQYTGFKDKNGKEIEIYEGDRIKQVEHIIGGTKKEEGNIEQASNGRYFVRIMWESGMECHANIAEDAEVIGNIHQNPESLENRK